MGILFKNKRLPVMGSSYRKRKKPSKILLLALLAVGFLAVGYTYLFYLAPSKEGETNLKSIKEMSRMSLWDGNIRVSNHIYDEIRSGENLYSTLSRVLVAPNEAGQIIDALKGRVDFRKLMPKTRLHVEWVSDTLSSLGKGQRVVGMSLHMRDFNGLPQVVKLKKNTESGQYEFSHIQAQVEKKIHMISGTVNGSLYSSMVEKGANASLVNDFSEIFGWQIDFYRDAKRGDFFKVIAEKSYVDGREIGFGDVMAAEYKTGARTYKGFKFVSEDGKIQGFFDEKGNSLKNAFLKAPMKLANISSRFGMRFHPVLKYHRPHNGVDYGARVGTPFVSVAKGKVVRLGYGDRSRGNWVRVRHINGYETEYFHASKLAKGLRVGKIIEQGQELGRVGKTGLASGPHLHFGLLKDGKYIDPAKQISDKERGVPKQYVPEYLSEIKPLYLAFSTYVSGEPALLAKESDTNESES